MYVPLRRLAIGLLLVSAASACGDDGTGPAGSLGDFEPAQAAGAAEALFAPIYDGTGATYAVRDAWQTLTDQGVSFHRADARRTALFPRVTAGDLVFPAGFQGRTLAYDLADASWGIDTTRAGAPAGGVRVLWYQTDAAGNLAQPLVEEGYADLTDEDAGGATSSVGIRMVATTDSGDIVLADLTETLDVSDGPQYSEVLRTTGFYGGASREIGFDMVSDASGDSITGAEDLLLSVSLNGQSDSYVLTITGSAASDTSVVEQEYRATVTHDAGITELALDFVEPPGGDQTGTGTLSHDGTARVRVSVSGSDFQYTDMEGRQLSSTDQVNVDTLVRTMFLTGLQAFLSLPLLFL